MRDQLAERFQRIRLKNKQHFIDKYGKGVNQECSICGQNSSYLYIFEDNCEGSVDIWDEINFWTCADCASNGRNDTHRAKVLREFMLFSRECDHVRDKYKFYNSIVGTPLYTEEERKNFISIIEYGKELEEQEAMYKRNAKRMKNARQAYEGKLIKTIIKTGGQGDTCFLCGKKIGKGCKCSDE